MRTWAGKTLGWLTLAAFFVFSSMGTQSARAAASPSITTHPNSQSVVLGSNAVFTVVASGQGTLFYQWTFNDTNLADSPHINGATNATLTVNSATGTDAGNYQVAVSNSHGSVTSSNATLTVLFPPSVISQPMSQAVQLGGDAVFTATFSGTEPLMLQWYFNGVPLTNGVRISGVSTPTLTISSVQLTDAGNYYLTGSNLINVATSAIAILTPVPVFHYVDANGTNPVSPYTNWSVAATCIQDAVSVATGGDTVVVTNGVYETGGYTVYGTTSNRVALTKPVILKSVNGPSVTLIKGYQMPGAIPFDPNSARCVYLTNGATLIGFTLTNGAAPDSGGGVWCESRDCVISNCVLIGNYAGGGRVYSGGGGAYGGTLINCKLIGNRTYESFGDAWGGGANNAELMNCLVAKNRGIFGGGAFKCSLKNCLITENQADMYSGGGSGYGAGALQCVLNNCTITTNRMSGDSSGGAGAYNCAMTNCIAYDNIMVVFDIHGIFWQQDNYNRYNLSGSNMAYCCTIPLQPLGIGNFSNPPCFVDPASGNFRLQTNSLCINAGNNLYAIGFSDLDGRPRINGSAVDVGAYEFQGADMGEFIGYLQKYTLATDGSEDYTDADGDILNNWQEWKSGTVPTNAVSVLKMASATNDLSGLVVMWQSVSGITYYLQRSSDLAGGFTSIVSNLVGQAGSTSYPDATATNAGPYFYRVGVQ